MEDRELFDLCKQVYEKTGWGDILQVINLSGQVISTISSIGNVTLYTSDYLLEKLPRVIQQNSGLSSNFFFTLEGGLTENEKWLVKYQDIDEGQLVAECSSTPLKALLKLTLALSEAGEL